MKLYRHDVLIKEQNRIMGADWWTINEGLTFNRIEILIRNIMQHEVHHCNSLFLKRNYDFDIVRTDNVQFTCNRDTTSTAPGLVRVPWVLSREAPCLRTTQCFPWCFAAGNLCCGKNSPRIFSAPLPKILVVYRSVCLCRLTVVCVCLDISVECIYLCVQHSTCGHLHTGVLRCLHAGMCMCV